MRRREFLRLSGGAFVATLGTFAGCTPELAPSPTLAKPATLGTFADDATIREIGRGYLSLVPRETRSDRLVRALLEDEEGELLDQGDADALTGILRTKIRSDFEADRTVLVDGWVLSVTEARQAALFSMIT